MSDALDHWAIISRMGDGKSTFAAQMSPEYLICDLDGRWSEQGANVRGKEHLIRESDPLKIVEAMDRLLASAPSIRTVVYDSGTALLDLLQSKGRLMELKAKETNQKFNLNNVHRLKADTMRVLRLEALKFHANVIWIFHLEDGMMDGKARVRTTIPSTELERLKSNLNAIMTIVRDPKSGMRGMRIEWCRYNNNVAAGQVIWDHEGMWRGVPDRMHTFIRQFTGSEGYNGNAYGLGWLQGYLHGKGVTFESTEDMKTKLGIRSEPAWFDRNGWAAFIKIAMPVAA